MGNELDMNATMIILGGDESLHVECGFHNMDLEKCPCPKGQGAWLEYRALLVAERRRARELEVKVLTHEAVAESRQMSWQQLQDLRATNELLGQEAARHENENRTLQAFANQVPDSEEKQMVALALADLSLRRPGWWYALNNLAMKMKIVGQFDAFRAIHKDLIKPGEW